jgi:tRNA(fMet)-specific endonuclease VapC
LLWVLDTDHISILQHQDPAASSRLRARLREFPESDVAVTVISFQEQAKGWNSFLTKARTPERVVTAYAELARLLEYFCKARVLPFDQSAAARFAELQRQHLRVGTLDLRIASIVLSRNATLLTRNLRDFRKVPGLVTEDWTS